MERPPAPSTRLLGRTRSRAGETIGEMTVERRRFRVSGVVQGVGFRPFVYGLGQAHRLGGFVLNDGSGVVVEAEGEPAALDAFATALRTDAPALARVDEVRA